MIFLSIDLQPGFSISISPQIIKAAQEEVRRAIRYNYDIVFLEYKGHGSTLPEIKTVAKNYINQVTIKKMDDDGGLDVMDAAYNNQLRLNNIRVCGVNTDMCVYETVSSLTHLSPASKILLRKDGCGSFWKNDFNGFKKFRNVKIINGK